MRILRLLAMLMLLGLTACDGTAQAQVINVTAQWTATGDDGNVGTATSYDLRWATSNITAATWATATQVAGEPAPKVAGSAETFTFSMTVVSGTTYYFALKAKDEANNESGLSNVVSFTPDTVAPGVISNVTIMFILP